MDTQGEPIGVRFTPQAFGDLGEWTHRFAGILERHTLELARQVGPSVVTSDVVRQAVLLACRQLADEGSDGSKYDESLDGNRPRVA